MKEAVYTKIQHDTMGLNDLTPHRLEALTAEAISSALGIQRNTASHYLNQLNREGKLIKINTRPVYYLDRGVFGNEVRAVYPSLSQFQMDARQLRQSHPQSADTVFDRIIGHEYSIRPQIEQLKSAVLYPPNGLPILIQGPAGTGKSLLSEKTYEYAVERGILPAQAPFITLNCAQYADNRELLSAFLFGYKKGAFTGAYQDTPGAIEHADGGFLFLDEAHRLDSAGQEKLFTFLDRGVFSRIGESGMQRTANVHFIFATTEDVDDTFIDTFLRRVPIIVTMPSLDQRRIEDKKTLIHLFFGQESAKLKQRIYVSAKVLNILTSRSYESNIGELKKLITIIC